MRKAEVSPISKERLLVLVLSVVKARAFLLLRSSGPIYLEVVLFWVVPFPHQGSSQLGGLRVAVTNPRGALQGQVPGAAIFCCSSVLLAEQPCLWEPPVCPPAPSRPDCTSTNDMLCLSVCSTPFLVLRNKVMMLSVVCNVLWINVSL